MAYILGEREFWGLTFKVTRDVLVPRPDSETVIEAARALLPERANVLRILDLGVGSGCLLFTLLKEFPEAQGVGVDASAAALDPTCTFQGRPRHPRCFNRSASACAITSPGRSPATLK